MIIYIVVQSTLKLILVHMISMYKQQTCMHQGDPCFGDSSGKQCVANCIVFFMMKLMLESRKQTICKTDLDNILMLGSMLYSSLYADSGNNYLFPTDTPSDLEVFDHLFKLSLDEPL